MMPVDRMKPVRRSASDGFTLVEVLMVVVIVAILLGIALPSYQNSVTKGRRSDGMAALMDVANRQEGLMLDRNTYTTDMTVLGFAADPMESDERYYTVDAAPCATGTIANCYVLTATPRAGGPQKGDSRCGNLVLDSTGAKSASGSAPDECW